MSGSKVAGTIVLWVEGVVHELPRELNPFVDSRRSHPSGFELLMQLFRVARSGLVQVSVSEGVRSPP